MTLLLSLKVFLISAGLLFTALGLNVSVPLIVDFLATHVPLTWNFCLSCFKPPYLFLLTNAIIITIAACSRFHRSDPPPPSKAPPYPHAYVITKLPPLSVEEELPAVVDVKAVVVNGVAAADDDGTESTWTMLERTESMEAPPPTLEEVWKAITEGKAMALKKSETFKGRRNPTVCALRREPPLLSQDELNQRAEAFIRKFNEEMRLQKQETLNRYMERMKRDSDSFHV